MIPNYTWFGRDNKIRIPKNDKLIIVENQVSADIFKYREKELVYYEKAWHLFIEQTIKSMVNQYDMEQIVRTLKQKQGVFETKISIVPRLSLAVDFDGTLFSEGNYPVPGDPIIDNINICKRWKELDLILILYTAREDKNLELAVAACREQGIEFDYINENLPWGIERWGDSRKIVADYYLDDRSISLPELKTILEV